MTRWRRAVIAGGALVVAVTLTGRTDASTMDYLVNGGPTLLVFDANGNGVIPDAGDCVVTGTSSGGSDFALKMVQHAGSPGAVPLQVCQPCEDNNGGLRTLVTNGDSQYTGDGFVSANAAGAAIQDTCISGLGTPMVSIEVRGTGPSGSPTPTSLVTGDLEPLLMPVAGSIFNDEELPRENLGAGILCRVGAAPGVAVEGRGGLRLLVDLKQVSSDGTDYRCAAVPMPRADTGAIVTIDSCLPVDSQDRSVLSLGGFSLIGIDFRLLPACGGERVPTTSELGLVALALALIAGGTLLLRRRAAFKQAMPRF